MKRKFTVRRPSAAMLVAATALFVALGGTSYAAFTLPSNSVGTKQLKNGAVTTKKIKNGAVTASKINTTGLTVPNALQANNANTAGNASNAANANHANTANSSNTANTATNAAELGGVGPSGYQPALEYARVNANGTLVASQSKGVISVTNPVAGLYCFQLATVPNVAVVAPEHIGGQFNTSVQASVRPDVATHTSTCSEPNRDASVAIEGGAGPNLENDDFMVMFS